MNRSSLLWLSLPLTLALGIIVSGCEGEVPEVATKPRPVEALRLSITDPSEALRLTGTVDPWAAEDIAFEVSGRLSYITEAGTAVEGHWEEAGQSIVQGDLIGRLDGALFEAAKRVAAAQVRTAEVRLESVLPAQVEAATAELERAQDKYSRVKKLLKKRSISESEVVASKQAFEVARANLKQAESSLGVGQADLERAQAALVKAEIDQDHTRLYAPFSGEVANVHLQAGGFAKAGQPVVRLVMMDPIVVKVIVSPDTNEKIHTKDPVRLFISDWPEPWIGQIHQKSTIADPATRTFEVTVITRNAKVPSESFADPAVLDLPRVSDLRVVLGLEPESSEDLFVQEKEVLREDDQGYFVWLAEGLTSGVAIDPTDPTFTVRKVRVVPGPRRMNFQGIFLMRELADPGDLEYRHLVVANPPQDLKDGDRVALVRESWLLQPGMLVDVQLAREMGVAGFYVPVQAISPTGADSGYILTVSSADSAEEDGALVAEQVEVTRHETVGQLQRIEPREPDAIRAGMWVIEKGLNFIRPGERVHVVAKRQG